MSHMRRVVMVWACLLGAWQPGQAWGEDRPTLVVVSSQQRGGPKIQPQVVSFVERPLKKSATLMPFSRYYAAARAAGFKGSAVFAPEAAIPGGRGANAAYVLFLTSTLEAGASGGKSEAFVAVRLISVATGEELLTQQVALPGKKLTAAVGARIAADADAHLGGPPPTAPQPAVMPAPIVAPPDARLPPDIDGGGDSTAVSTAPNGARAVEPEGAADASGSALPPPPAHDAAELPSNPALVAPQTSPPTAAPALVAPTPVLIAPEPAAPSPASADILVGSAEAARHVSTPARMASWRPGFVSDVGALLYWREAAVQVSSNAATPCYCAPDGEATPIFSRLVLRTELYPMAFAGTGRWFEGFGLRLDGSIGWPRTALADGAVYQHASGQWLAALQYRWVPINSTLSPDFTLGVGYGAYSFPLAGSSFVGLSFRSPTVDVGASVPLGTEAIALVARADLLPLLDGYGGTGALGTQASHGFGVHAEAGLRARIAHVIDLQALFSFDHYGLAFTGTTALPQSAVQWQNVTVFDRLLGAYLLAGTAF